MTPRFSEKAVAAMPGVAKRRSNDGHFHEVPLAGGTQIAALDGHHAIGRAAELPRVELGVERRVVVEDLHLAHAQVGVVAAARIANGQAVVAGRRQAEVDPRGEIGVFLLGVDRAALLRLADDRAVFDLVLVDGPAPTGEVLAVEDVDETGRVVLPQDLVGLVEVSAV